jgi:hypothetical protein
VTTELLGPDRAAVSRAGCEQVHVAAFVTRFDAGAARVVRASGQR